MSLRSASTLRVRNTNPTRPSTNSMAPAIISQCGYSIDERASVISRRDRWQITSGASTVPTCLASTGSSLSQSLPSLRFLERYFDAPHSSRFSYCVCRSGFLGVGIERKHDVTIRRLHDPGRIPCKRGGGRSSTKANRPNIGCCRLRGRPRAIRPDRRVGICRSIVHVAAEPSRMISRLTVLCKLSIPSGLEQRQPQRVVRGRDRTGPLLVTKSARIVRTARAKLLRSRRE